MSSNTSTMDDRIGEILDYMDDELYMVVSPGHFEVYSHLHDMISSLYDVIEQENAKDEGEDL